MKQTERLLAVGDIHGCLEKIEILMEAVCPSENDTVVFLGDYINCGPNSKGVVDYLLRLSTSFKTIFLMGNHEKMLLEYIERGAPSFLLNGGDKTIESYSNINLAKMPEKHLMFFKNLLPYFETDEFIFVHAGLRPGVKPEHQTIDDMLWIRDEFLNSEFDWGKTVVFGHSVCHEPKIIKNRICIDTGCSYPEAEGFGKLTCLDARSQQIWSV